MNAFPAKTPSTPQRRAIEVELLALDLTSCNRCLGTLGNIETAVKMLKPVLDAAGFEVRFRKVLITSDDQARWHRFTTSPTIRVNGCDLDVETGESACDACSDNCGCPPGTACRLWRYRGREFAEAPVGLVVEALLKQILQPESCQAPGSRVNEECCTTSEQEDCCEANEKATCCPTAGSCGCR